MTQRDLEQDISSTLQVLAGQLIDTRQSIASAESCTGGWIAKCITDIDGCSQWFDTGFVTYSNAAKQRLLQVPASLFELGAPGAVSEERVGAMTAGALATRRAQLAVAVSGIAGPDGGSREKPVGTVWIAWQWEEQALARCFHFAGDREAVRLATVVAALEGCLLLLEASAQKKI